MAEDSLQLLRTAAFLGALAMAVTVQRLRPHARLGGSVRVNVALGVAGALLTAAVCGACGFVTARWAGEAGLGLANVAGMPLWLELVLAIALLDLVSYLWHRANHTVTFLWRFHQVHHSDARFTVSTGLRFHPGELLLALPVRLAAIVVVGASPLAVLVFEAAFATSNLFEHGDIDLPPALERAAGRLLVVPALHRRHHSCVRDELNGNYGTILIGWDRLFGTFGESSSERTFRIGLPGCSAPARFRDVLLLPVQLLPGRR